MTHSARPLYAIPIWAPVALSLITLVIAFLVLGGYMIGGILLLIPAVPVAWSLAALEARDYLLPSRDTSWYLATVLGVVLGYITAGTVAGFWHYTAMPNWLPAPTVPLLQGITSGAVLGGTIGVVQALSYRPRLRGSGFRMWILASTGWMTFSGLAATVSPTWFPPIVAIHIYLVHATLPKITRGLHGSVP